VLYCNPGGGRFIYGGIPATCRPLGAARGESIDRRGGTIRLPVELNVGNYTARDYATSTLLKGSYAEVNIAVEECLAG